jgi:hypothetical protein
MTQARLLACCAAFFLASALSPLVRAATSACATVSDKPLTTVNPDKCKQLADKIRRPSALPLKEHEDIVNVFFGNYCHRDPRAGWVRDKKVRDTGPFTATLVNGAWNGQYFGTHAPVVAWYPKEAFDWMRKTRLPGVEVGKDAPPPPEGAIIVKEMFPPPAAACDGIDPEDLSPIRPGINFLQGLVSAAPLWNLRYWMDKAA